jgi:hypothetical protein
MAIHFEELWEKCENMHKDLGSGDSVANVIDELAMKINLYKLLDGKTEITEEERQKIKSRTLGEILLTLTNLSLKDNINVFESLSIAQQMRAKSSGLGLPKELRLPTKKL